MKDKQTLCRCITVLIYLSLWHLCSVVAIKADQDYDSGALLASFEKFSELFDSQFGIDDAFNRTMTCDREIFQAAIKGAKEQVQRSPSSATLEPVLDSFWEAFTDFCDRMPEYTPIRSELSFLKKENSVGWDNTLAGSHIETIQNFKKKFRDKQNLFTRHLLKAFQQEASHSEEQKNNLLSGYMLMTALTVASVSSTAAIVLTYFFRDYIQLKTTQYFMQGAYKK